MAANPLYVVRYHKDKEDKVEIDFTKLRDLRTRTLQGCIPPRDEVLALVDLVLDGAHTKDTLSEKLETLGYNVERLK